MTGLLAAGVALLSAGLMGYAIQRGATCAVAAMEEIVRYHTAHRTRALAEAALWVAAGLLLSRQFGLLATLPHGFSASGWAIGGGVLLGLGAWLNRACVFGAIARLGSGEWAYVATPAGFFGGATAATSIFSARGAESVATSTIGMVPGWIGWLVLPFALWRLTGVVTQRRTVWNPHEATLVIGITFVILLLVSGPWTYTDVLTEAAMGMTGDIGFRGLLFAGLVAGACLGGWTAGRLRSRPVAPAGLARCFAGGAMMGAGSLLIPGGNDGLILIGLPLLQPHAWLAIGTMCATIVIALMLERRFS